jgi:predicted nucleic acid-binding Zn ribbon protein
MKTLPVEEYHVEYKCLSCGEKCEIVEDTFDYCGTHCTHGKGGIHYTGVYVSKCCLEDFEEI